MKMFRSVDHAHHRPSRLAYNAAEIVEVNEHGTRE
jgi:hypothetical protein